MMAFEFVAIVVGVVSAIGIAPGTLQMDLRRFCQEHLYRPVSCPSRLAHGARR
jgi:hypothetical protein